MCKIENAAGGAKLHHPPQDRVKGLKTDQRFFGILTERIFYQIIVHCREESGKLFESALIFSRLLI